MKYYALNSKWLLMAALVFVSFSVSGQNADSLTLKKLNGDFLDAIVHRDTAALSHVLADDFELINPDGKKRSKVDNLIGILNPNQQVISVDIDSMTIKILSADVGLVTVWTTNSVRADGKSTSFKICYQDVYMKRKSKWWAVAAHVTLLAGH